MMLSAAASGRPRNGEFDLHQDEYDQQPQGRPRTAVSWSTTTVHANYASGARVSVTWSLTGYFLRPTSP